MNACNNTCRCPCILAAGIVSLILGILAAFLQITGMIAIGTPLLWALLGIAVAYLGLLVLAAAPERDSGGCDCLCPVLRALLTGILGTVLFAVILLVVDIAAASVLGALLTGLLVLSFALMLTASACFVRSLFGCGD